MKKIFFSILFLGLLSCTDGFRELNTDPNKDTNPNPAFILPQAMKSFEIDWHRRVFNQVRAGSLPYSGYATESWSSGNTSDIVTRIKRDKPIRYITILNYCRKVRDLVSKLPEDKKGQSQALVGVSYILPIYAYISNLDFEGEMRYSEACLAPYTNPPLLTPRFDTQQDMFNMWLEELDTALELLNTENQNFIARSDIFFDADISKWKKAANSLKLRIASFLINADRTKALQIAQDVANSEHGYIDSLEEEWVLKFDDDRSGWGDDCWFSYGTDMFVDFLKRYKDPRLFYYFRKNDFNPSVIQAFIDEGLELPPFIQETINFDAEGNFESFRGEGEPWCRYFGQSTNYNSVFKESLENKFHFKQNDYCRLDGSTYTYKPFSFTAERQFMSAREYTYPRIEGQSKKMITGNKSKYTILLCSAAETNIFLAEFSAYGAQLPQSTDFYLKRGAEFSIRRAYQRADAYGIAYLDGDPYYNDNNLSNLHLTEDQITEYINSELFDCTTDAKEKVYLQMYVERFSRLDGQYCLMKRSGIPKVGSQYLPWIPMNGTGELDTWIRRWRINTPDEAKTDYKQLIESYTRQGFTLDRGEHEILESERFWWDINNPRLHTGPKD